MVESLRDYESIVSAQDVNLAVERFDPVLQVGCLSRGRSIVIWSGLMLATVTLMAIAPWPVSFAIAVAVAGGWCWWLDRRQR